MSKDEDFIVKEQSDHILLKGNFSTGCFRVNIFLTEDAQGTTSAFDKWFLVDHLCFWLQNPTQTSNNNSGKKNPNQSFQVQIKKETHIADDLYV